MAVERVRRVLAQLPFDRFHPTVRGARAIPQHEQYLAINDHLRLALDSHPKTRGWADRIDTVVYPASGFDTLKIFANARLLINIDNNPFVSPNLLTGLPRSIRSLTPQFA